MTFPHSSQPFSQRARTKIVATVGPACDSRDKLSELISAGVDVFRINTAHGSTVENDRKLADIRWAASQQDRPIAILVDLAGPKIRLGTLLQDPLDCNLGDELDFIRGSKATLANELTCTYDKLIDELDEGDRVLLADGTVGLKVVERQRDRARCKVFAPGVLRSRQGVNLPGVKLSVPSMTEADHEHAVWAAKNNIDFVSLSFVRSADDIRQLKVVLRELANNAMTIAKIEKPEALDCLEEIVSAADGIMVARGDLGVEIDIERTPVEQKRIIDICTKYRRPVIVATQMLDSMHTSRRPTRAEASDVANAILDGADACMLSGETAIGDYPVESVNVMNRIMLATEQRLVESPPVRVDPDPQQPAVHPVTESVVFGAGRIAERIKAKVIAIQTLSGRTALAKSKYRDLIPCIAVSNKEQTLRQMALFWGIEPVVGAPTDDASLRQFIDEWGQQQGVVQSGDLVVLIASGDFKSRAHNRLMVYEVN